MKRRECLEMSCKVASYLSFAVPIIGMTEGCKSPAEPEEPKEFLNYRTVEVTYNRNPDKIINLGSEWVSLFYRLYDPKAEHYDREWEEYIDSYRWGDLTMKQQSDLNEYKIELKHILVQADEYNEKHFAYIRDPQIWTSKILNSQYTTDGLKIPGAYDISLCDCGYILGFKMSAGYSS
jgi:hypothetical protein